MENQKDTDMQVKAEKGKFKEFMAEHFEKLQVSKFNLVLTVLAAIILMFVVCFIVFTANLKGEERVMVPDVVGKDLGQALQEMQQKELYQKIQFRYTDDPNDAGKVLSQTPEAGTIVKASRRINLVVSRGSILNHVENYVGENLDDVKIKLQTMFTSTRPLVILDTPVYKADVAPAGTIIAQDPPEGTPISTPVTVKLVVSKGSDYETVKVPNLVGLSVNKIYAMMENSKLIFDFISHEVDSSKKEVAGTASYQQKLESPFVRTYSHVSVDIATDSSAKKVVGIFSQKVTKYPYAVSMSLVANKDGKKTTLVSFKHMGGTVSVPYEVEHGTELILTVADKNVAKIFVD